LRCLRVCRRAASVWARRAAVSPRTTSRRVLPVESRGEATPSRAHRMSQSGQKLWAALLGKLRSSHPCRTAPSGLDARARRVLGLL
jgi:hypothetical protein